MLKEWKTIKNKEVGREHKKEIKLL